MPDLSPIPSIPLTPLTLPTSPVPILKALNPLREPKDGTFLARPDHMAGRHVCIVLYATGNSRDERERAWRSLEGTLNMKELGIAAKAIESAGYNWRELDDCNDVFAAAESLQARGASN